MRARDINKIRFVVLINEQLGQIFVFYCFGLLMNLFSGRNYHLPLIERKKNVIKIILQLYKYKSEFQWRIECKSISVKGYSIATNDPSMQKTWIKAI